MELRALVSQSTFSDILSQIKPYELGAVRKNIKGEDGQTKLTVTAEMTLTRLLQIAKEHCATIVNPRKVRLAHFDRLCLEAHKETRGFGYESYEGHICIWTNSEEESL